MKKIITKILLSTTLLMISTASSHAQGLTSKLHVKTSETKEQSLSAGSSGLEAQFDVVQIPDQEIRDLATKLAHDYFTVDYRETYKLTQNIKPYAHPDQSWALRGVLKDRIESIEKNKFRIVVLKVDDSKLAMTVETNAKGIAAKHVTVPVSVKITSDLNNMTTEQKFIFGVFLVKQPKVPSNPDGLAIWSIGREDEEIAKK